MFHYFYSLTYSNKTKLILKKNINYFLITFVIFFSCLTASARFLLPSPVPVYHNLKKGDNGLTSDIIYRVFTDKYGYVWLATEKGLMIYNGRQFIPFHLPGNDQEIVTTWNLGDKLLCFSYSGNIINVDVATRKATLFRNPDTAVSSKTNHTPFILCHRSADSLFLLNASGVFVTIPLSSLWAPGRAGIPGIWRISSHFFTTILSGSPHYEAGLVNATDIYHALGSSEHSVKMKDSTLICKNKIYRINPPGKGISLLFDADRAGKSQEVINDYIRHGNDLWVGYFNGSGLICYRNYFSHSPYTPFINPVTIVPDVRVGCIDQDQRGTIRVATLGNGLYVFTPAGLSLRYYSCSDKHLFYDPDIRFIAVKDSALITGYNYPVADIKKQYENRRLIAGDRREKNMVQYLYDEAPITMITHKGFYSFDPKMKRGPLIPGTVKDAYEQDGNLYIGIKGRYTIRNGTASYTTYVPAYANISIAPASDKGMLLGTTHGLYKDSFRINELGSERILKVRQYNGTILAATTSGIHILRQGKPSQLLSTGNGLAGNYCFQLAASGAYYYALTDGGISVIDTATLHVAHVYSTNELMPGLEVNYFAIHNGRLWMATNKGIIETNAYHPAGDIYSPPIYIIAADTFKTKYISDTTVRPYSRNQPVFYEIDILDNSIQQPLISYRIEETDGRQVLPPQNLATPAFSVNGLWPGEYNVYVTVRSMQSGWVFTQRHVLIIRPLWWQHLWIGLFAFVLLSVCIFLIARFFFKRKAAKARQRLEQQHYVLQLRSKLTLSQLKPHFIFNALNPLQPLIINQQVRDALQYIEQFSKLMRNMITLWRTDHVSLKKEAAFLEQYVYIQQRRFATEFRFIIEMPPGEVYENLQIPSMLLQPLVENAVEHGLLRSAAADNFIKITFEPDLSSGQLKITVFNTGAPLPDGFKPAEDHALFMIMERIVLIRQQTGIGVINCENVPGGVGCYLILPILN